jgi:hypothetical protein
MLRLGTCLALLALASSAFATDGVIEINAARAAAGGVTPGDTPGFPVEIFTRGNFRLTSDLVVPAGASAGIAVYAAGTRIDLNGFTISSTTTCSGTPLSCSPSGTGIGIDASAAEAVLVRNGRVTGFGVYGVFLSAGSRAEKLMVDNDALGGIVADEAAIVTDCLVRHNGGPGISAGDDSRIAESVVSRNGGPGIQAPQSTISDRNSVNHNTVGTGSAGSRLRRYYLSATRGSGGGARSQCAPGFHMASLFELTEPSHLSYDGQNGYSRGPQADEGGGPPTLVDGWIRSGYDGNPAMSSAGEANCNAWTSSSGSSNGSLAHLNANWQFSSPDPAGTATWPWQTSTAGCGGTQYVWCIED